MTYFAWHRLKKCGRISKRILAFVSSRSKINNQRRRRRFFRLFDVLSSCQVNVDTILFIFPVGFCLGPEDKFTEADIQNTRCDFSVSHFMKRKHYIKKKRSTSLQCFFFFGGGRNSLLLCFFCSYFSFISSCLAFIPVLVPTRKNSISFKMLCVLLAF